ncbi:MAG: hypothetical protein ACLQRM_16370 [Acidimicrobiales bacterium]
MASDPEGLTVEQRLGRLEDVVVALAAFVTENDVTRFTRSLAGADAGVKVLRFVGAIQAERTAAGDCLRGTYT